MAARGELFSKWLLAIPHPHRLPQPHAMLQSEQQRGSHPECGGAEEGKGVRDIGLADKERVNKPEQINIISSALDARRTDSVTSCRTLRKGARQLVGAGAVAVSLAAHMAKAAAAPPAFVQIVQRRRRRIDIPFSVRPTAPTKSEDRPTACVVLGRLLLERRERASGWRDFNHASVLRSRSALVWDMK